MQTEDHAERRSSSLLRIAGEVAHVGGWTYDRHSNEVHCSDEIRRITGLPSGQTPPPQQLFAQFPTAEQTRVVAAATACLQAGTPFALELAYTTFDGRDIWVRFVGEAQRDRDGAISGLQGALQDITEQHQARQETERLAARLDTTMRSITDALFIVDNDWQFTYLNPRAEQLLDRTAGSLLGRAIWDEFPDVVGTPLDAAYHRAVEEHTTVTVDAFHYPPLELWVEARAFPSADGLTVLFRDIGEQHRADVERHELLAAERAAAEQAKQAQITITHQSSHDPLTGLYNRSEILARLEAPGPIGFTVLLLDLDGFRQVNAALGHTGGNGLLMHAAVTLQSLTRRRDVLARVGGDEFALLLPGHDPEAADQVAARILDAFRTPMQTAGERLFVTASIGIARAYPGEAGETALRNADIALYRAKEQGRNCSVWYDPMPAEPGSQHLAVAAELYDALTARQLLLHYQPSFGLQTARPLGAEALVRWQHPVRGLLPPGQFVPIAEQAGLIEPLGAWCLAEALAAVPHWPVDEPFTVWVNVAVQQLGRPGLARHIEQLLATTGLTPARLGIEITESAFAQDRGTVLAELRTLSDLGVRIAMDDFGTGYSSLARLGHLPIDLLKIDRGFVAKLDTAAGVATAAAIIALAHATDIPVIAEGVETHEQLETLARIDCDQVSGFHLARPDAADKLADACIAGTQTIEALDVGRLPARA